MSTEPLRLSSEQRARIQLRHKASISQFGYQPKALFWSDQRVQQMRFDVLLRIMPSLKPDKHQAWSILDVGCGFADLYRRLKQLGYEVEYHGLDISADMIFSARCLHPDALLYQGELADQSFAPQSFDFVFLSGALNEVVDEDGCYAKSVIKQLYSIARFGVGFNLLNKHDSWIASRSDLQSFYPAEIVVFCESFAESVDWFADYLPNDFSVFMSRQGLRLNK